MQKEVTDSNDTFKFEIKEVVAETIKELHAADTGIRFKKPTTVQGWLAISIATITIISFFISSIIFLNEVTQWEDYDDDLPEKSVIGFNKPIDSQQETLEN